MPIRPEFRQFYGREWREVTRPRILARAGNKCEQCGKPNHALVETVTSPYWNRMWWRRLGAFAAWRNAFGETTVLEIAGENSNMHRVRVVLTIAHLDHTPGHDEDANLKALCQWCHLNYDKLHHHETRSTRKDAARPLLVSA